MRKGIMLILSMVIILFILWGCDFSGLEQVFEGIPGPEFNIPAALLPQSVQKRAVEDDVSGIFEPFRAGLSFAQYGVEFVDMIIEALNETVIPDNGEFISDGELVVISTDHEREYATVIEFYLGETAVPDDKYLQISYTKGINKGETVFDVGKQSPGDDVDMVKLYYDGTGDQPILKGWLEFVYDEADVYVIYPRSVYFNATKNNNKVTIEGGLSYHYKFDDQGDSPDDTYVDDHVYMYKAIGDNDNDMAIVDLYFPQYDIPLSALDNWEISDSMLFILYEWINKPGNATLKSDLEGLYESPIDSAQDLYDVLDGNRNVHEIASLLFILELDNSIAYNATDGYVANGADVPPDYTAIGDIGAVVFSEAPLDIHNTDITF